MDKHPAIPETIACCKLDPHAGTSVAGSNLLAPIEGIGEGCDEFPYSKEYRPVKSISIVNAATPYTHIELPKS